LLKARAGGGGKGMRLVDDEAYFEKAYLEAQLEADLLSVTKKYI